MMELTDPIDVQRTINVRCDCCGTNYPITVYAVQYEAWHAGELIQRAMPDLTDDERELLISQTCGRCFDALFPEE